MRTQKKPNIYQTPNGKWMLDLGMVFDKAKNKNVRWRQTCNTKALAEQFAVKMQDKIRNEGRGILAGNDFLPSDIAYWLKRIQHMGVSLQTVTEFYQKHGPKGGQTLSLVDAIEQWKQHQITKGNRLDSITKSISSTYLPFHTHFLEKLSGRYKKARTTEEWAAIADEHNPTLTLSYFDKTNLLAYLNDNKDWSFTTWNTRLNSLRTFFSYFVKEGVIGLNPLANVSRKSGKNEVIDEDEKISLIIPDDFDKWLNLCVQEERWNVLAYSLLLAYCGIRSNEAFKLKWGTNVRLEEETIVVDERIAKKKGRRIVDKIPLFVIEWFQCIPEKRRKDGLKVIPVTVDGLQTMYTKTKNELKLEYLKQNWLRHSFASYHLEQFGDKDRTAWLMSHTNSDLLFSTYKELIRDKKDVAAFWEIYSPETKKKNLKNYEIKYY